MGVQTRVGTGVCPQSKTSPCSATPLPIVPADSGTMEDVFERYGANRAAALKLLTFKLHDP